MLRDFDPAFSVDYLPGSLDRRVGVQLMCRLLDECVFDATGVSCRPVTPAMRELRARVAYITGPVDRWWVDYRSPAPLADGSSLETFVISLGSPYEVTLAAPANDRGDRGEVLLVEHGSLLVLRGRVAPAPARAATAPTLLGARMRVTLQRFDRGMLPPPARAA